MNVMKVKEIVKELRVFEKNKVPLEIKILGIAIYVQTSSIRSIPLQKFFQLRSELVR